MRDKEDAIVILTWMGAILFLAAFVLVIVTLVKVITGGSCV